MPIANVQMPDGRVAQFDVPEGTSPDAVTQAASHFWGQSQLKAQNPAEFDPSSQEFQDKFGATAGMSGGSKFLAGAGQAVSSVGLRAKQLAASLHDLVSNGPSQSADVTQQIDQAQQRDKPLLNTGAGLAGNVAGNLGMMYVGGSALRGAGALADSAGASGAPLTTAGNALMAPTSLPQAIGGGAASGFLQPVGSNDSATLNTLAGGAAGGLGYGLGRALGRTIRPINAPAAPYQDLVQAADNYGIPLSVGQRSGSRPLQVAEGVMENLPLTSGPRIAQQETQQQAFNRAALSHAGINSDTADAATLAAQRKNLGNTFDSIAGRNNLNFNNTGLIGDLSNIVQNSSQHLDPPNAQRVAGRVDQILSQVDQNGNMLGSNYQGWREPLRQAASSGDETGRYFGQIRSALDNHFSQQVSGQDAQDWATASGQYGNLKTILNAMGGAGAGTKLGNISPAQLESSLTQNVGREGKALGRGNLNQLVAVGRNFVSPTIPDSGTSQRQFWTNLLTGHVAGVVPGAAVGYHEDGLHGAALGAAAGATGALALPRLAQALMNSRPGAAYLTRGAVPLTPQQLQYLAAALRNTAVSGQVSLAH